MDDTLSKQGIEPYLADPLLIGRIHIHGELESTNNTAKEMIINGAVTHGTVIIADSQSGGRGRFERSFFSPPGSGLYMSVILDKERLWASEPTVITAYAAVSVCEAIAALTGEKAGIKWVNDVFLAGKKVCGILTEAAVNARGGAVEWVIVGIGINCRAAEGCPEEYRETVGDIALDAAEKTRNELAAEIINRLASSAPPEKAEIVARYRQRLLYLGKKVTVHDYPDSYVATALDIDESAHLIVRKADGETVCLTAGEISIRPYVRPRLNIRDLCEIGIFTAIIAVTAQLIIPMPSGISLTLQTFVIPLASIVLGIRKGTWATLIYILLGIAGVPVFAGFRGGLAMVTGVTGGFILTFPLMSLTAGWHKSYLKLALGLLAGAALNYLGGTLMYAAMTGTSLGAAFYVCVAPYLPTAAAKIALLLLVGPRIKGLLAKAGAA
ncbi:MAG: biotin--[acetyl-CoA-carboxylase] ligase [Lachnospiraceae bacterium]|nr:biotin--[acetyl-CoA-carboxylase] ligase [Lachnospiraceae bacterium]